LALKVVFGIDFDEISFVNTAVKREIIFITDEYFHSILPQFNSHKFHCDSSE
jgi:hypothetical protein